MKNSLFIISKLCMLAFILLLAQGCQEDYEMIDPPMMTDYDDDLDEEEIMQKGLESYLVTQFGEWMVVPGNRRWMWLASVSC